MREGAAAPSIRAWMSSLSPARNTPDVVKPVIIWVRRPERPVRARDNNIACARALYRRHA
jgi:hypothetical protein